MIIKDDHLHLHFPPEVCKLVVENKLICVQWYDQNCYLFGPLRQGKGLVATLPLEYTPHDVEVFEVQVMKYVMSEAFD